MLAEQRAVSTTITFRRPLNPQFRNRQFQPAIPFARQPPMTAAVPPASRHSLTLFAYKGTMINCLCLGKDHDHVRYESKCRAFW